MVNKAQEMQCKNSITLTMQIKLPCFTYQPLQAIMLFYLSASQKNWSDWQHSLLASGEKKNLNGHINWDNFLKWQHGNVLCSEQVPNHIHQTSSLDSSWWRWYSNVEMYICIFSPSLPVTTHSCKQSTCPINVTEHYSSGAVISWKTVAKISQAQALCRI